MNSLNIRRILRKTLLLTSCVWTVVFAASERWQSSAEAQAALQERWQRSADGRLLTWQAPEPIPVFDAFIEVQINDTLRVTPSIAKDRRSLSVLVAPDQVVSSLRVTAAGHPIDAREPSRGVVQRQVVDEPAAAALPPLSAADDPGRNGVFQTTQGEYDEAPITLPGLPTPVELRALVVAPVGASGPSPVAVFVHGQHVTCYSAQGEDLGGAAITWPCPADTLAVPSYRGFVDAQRLLASQGVVSISISANGVNAQASNDYQLDAAARAALLREHLTKLSRAAGSIAGLQGVNPDLQRVLLIGHSRGGDGVNRFALETVTDSAAPWRIQAQLLIAPTLYQRNPAPGVPAVVLLPACDGDVLDLQGQYFADAARDLTQDNALRSVVFIEGANHNYFNTQWTPGIAPAGSGARDDWPTYLPADDSACGTDAPTRLSAPAQRTLGSVYIAAAAQTFLFGREAAAQLFDGTPVRAPSAGPARVLAHALGGYRAPLLIPSEATAFSGSAGLTVQRCLTTRGFGAGESCRSLEVGYQARTPSFGPLIGTPDEPSHSALQLAWSSPGGQADIQLSSAQLDPQATSVALRVIVAPQTADNAFTAHLLDKAGHRLELGRTRLDGLPTRASAQSGAYWAQEVRLGLDPAAIASAGIDLTQLDKLGIVADSAAGQLWVLDAWSQRAGLPAVSTRSAARFDVQSIRVRETDTDQVVMVPATVIGRLAEPARVYFAALSFRDGQYQTGYLELAAGTTSFGIPVTVRGDEQDAGPFDLRVQVTGITGVVASHGTATSAIEDDEVTPDVTYTAEATAQEGMPLRWTFSLPAPSARLIYMKLAAVAPDPGISELSRADIDPEGPNTPLSQAQERQTVILSPGEVTFTLELPTVADDLTEGDESIVYEITDEPLAGPIPGIPSGTRIKGTVTDSP